MSDYHLSWNPMEGPTPRQERAMEVAARFNRLYRVDGNPNKRCTLARVLVRWNERRVYA